MMRKLNDTSYEKSTLSSPQKLHLSHRLLPLLVVLLVVILTGCTTLPSGKTAYTQPAQATEAELQDVRELLEQAIQATYHTKEAQSFWYNGYIINNMQNRAITSMYEGVAMRPDESYLVNARINAHPFVYHRIGEARHIYENGIWYKPGGKGGTIDEQDLMSFDPLHGYADWLPLMEEATVLPDEAILNSLSHVLEVRINAKEWIERSPSVLFDELRAFLMSTEDDVGDDPASTTAEEGVRQLQANAKGTQHREWKQWIELFDMPEMDEQALLESLDHLLDNTIVKMTIWISKDDFVINQYSTWIVMPMPGVGYFDQQTFFRFYHYNDPSIPSHFRELDYLEDRVRHYEKLQEERKLERELLQ